MSKPRNFLFVCKGNEARSQMAEGFARTLAQNSVNVYSAGIAPKGINPHAVDVMAELGIDISKQGTKDFKKVPLPKIDTIITLSSDADPLPKLDRKKITQIHWPLNDPTAVSGSDAEVKKAFRAVRDEIRNRVQVLLVG
ncbi:MAG TPA: arsenate reductase ArsC [Planctomycetota bacterium]|jgi:arsenate reductase|nr:arsenate reductase ArsC [Planctomycetota bacterium]HZJ72411.1 arsenate reductase ArsC [Planctomycetota bacterium]